jgi:hypothetical protein
MKVTTTEWFKDSKQMEVVDETHVALRDAVGGIVGLLGFNATNLVLSQDGEGTLFLHLIERKDVPACEMYHGFCNPNNAPLLANFLKQDLHEGVYVRNLVGFAEGFIDNYMPRLLNSLDVDVETKLKAVVAVLYGEAMQQSDIVRLVMLDWRDFLATIQMAQDEWISAIEALDMIEQPVAA